MEVFFGILLVVGIVWWNFSGKHKVKARIQAAEELKAEGFDSITSGEAKERYEAKVAEITARHRTERKKNDKAFLKNVVKHYTEK